MSLYERWRWYLINVISTVMFQDVDRLIHTLPNVVNVYKVPYTDFNHLDFVWAVDMKPLLYDNIIKTLNTIVTKST